MAFEEKSVSCFVRVCVWLVQTGPLCCIVCPSFISGIGKVLVTHFMLRCGNKLTALENGFTQEPTGQPTREIRQVFCGQI